jgi:hypothetical protein
VIELYDALKATGLDDQVARAAARAVIGIECNATLASKADLHELEARMLKWIAAFLIATIGTTVSLMKLLP